jgi:hypothetical protein
MVVSLVILASVTAANPPSKAAAVNNTNTTNSTLDVGSVPRIGLPYLIALLADGSSTVRKLVPVSWPIVRKPRASRRVVRLDLTSP